MAEVVKNILKFMKQVVSPETQTEHKSEIVEKNENSKAKKCMPMSREEYLENKYKRVKIINGEIEKEPKLGCDNSKKVGYDSDEETSSSSNRRYCNYTKKSKHKKQKRVEEQEDLSSTDSEDGNASCSRNRKCKDYGSCESIGEKFMAMLLTVRENCLKKHFDEIERNANALWNDCSTKLPQCGDYNANKKQWQNLKCMQKLPFYWAAISGDFLKETPFENFLRFYLDEKGIDDKCVSNNDFQQHVENLWNSMDENEKMPFVMESFMYRVSLGKVNLLSDKNIKDELDNINNGIDCHM